MNRFIILTKERVLVEIPGLAPVPKVKLGVLYIYANLKVKTVRGHPLVPTPAHRTKVDGTPDTTKPIIEEFARVTESVPASVLASFDAGTMGWELKQFDVDPGPLRQQAEQVALDYITSRKNFVRVRVEDKFEFLGTSVQVDIRDETGRSIVVTVPPA